MRIFDSHTHLNSEEFIQEVPRYLQQAADLDVTRMAIVGSNTQLNADAIKLAETYPQLVAIVGWHPEDAKNYDQAAEKLLIEQLQHTKVVALGEIGLDYHWDTSPQDVQRQVFARQVAIAKEMQLPISVHNRDAFEDTYKILKAADIRDTGGVMHSFNGDPEWLKRFLDLGMHISYSGVASFKNAREVHESVKQTPLTQMLVETDAPYLTPEPYRGKQNEPGYTRYVVEAIAKLRETTPEIIAAQTYQNAEEFFKIEKD
ncbi:TatD family hydrolase [Lactiplantibacillus paraplantarum]|uniref:TatD family hydrolase n=1 Tax=Lactiplantibacillus paraplantarum TaxID=60520 RepID=UPI0021CEF5A3|nr:TatD family hydrolase [Lactiplantibacillus paraplantarum]MCU4682615.1 TatD family hydrolase [Lactiplantibacillus paraplantarum]